jgi:signal transduction histidine kinase
LNKRIIVIDDEETILNDYLMILAPPPQNIALLQEKAALEVELFGESAGSEQDRQEQYQVTTARQGMEGYDKIKEAQASGKPFAVAFIDIRMPPGWDGLQTARRIRQLDGNIEFIIVTAYSDRERREIVDQVGTPEKLLYLKKPFDPDEIRQLALSLTRKWELERKTERHKEYLENLLEAVRRLKTRTISSIKEVLCAILKEVLHFVDARQGIIAKQVQDRICIEITSGDLSEAELNSLSAQLAQQSSQLINGETIVWIGDTMVMPLKDLSGNFFILALDIYHPVSPGKVNLLKLLLETSSEVLLGFRKQEQFLKSERIATIGELAAGIIHELNNPLSAITGAADIFALEAQKLGWIMKQYMQVVEHPDFPSTCQIWFQDVEKLGRPQDIWEEMSDCQTILQKGVNQIQVLMKNIRSLTLNQDSFVPQYQDIGEALEDTLILAHSSLKTGISIHKEWDRPLMAWCDINALKQVFLNLILNALQAMEGSGEIWIIGKPQEDNILISIRDSGPGISPHAQEKIFQAFYTTKSGGTGLGLSIVKGIVERHHGSIKVESAPERGTTFHVEIPVGG